MQQYAEELSRVTTCSLNGLAEHVNKTVRIAGLITNIRLRQTKRGDRMAIFTLDDGNATLDVVCFSDHFQKNRHLINEDSLVMVEGDASIDEFNQGYRVLLREIHTLSTTRETFAKHINVILSAEDHPDVTQLDTLLATHSNGSLPLKICYREDNIEASLTLGKRWLIKLSDEFLTDIKQLLTHSTVEIVY